jgi:hypothetical protein
MELLHEKPLQAASLEKYVSVKTFLTESSTEEGYCRDQNFREAAFLNLIFVLLSP